MDALTRSPCILVVEDEALLREVVARELTGAGYAVIEAASGAEGLEALHSYAVDWLFTDIRMPGDVDGWTLAEEFRRIHPTRPVVYATAVSGERPRQVEGSILFAKPYRPSQIVAAFERLTRFEALACAGK